MILCETKMRSPNITAMANGTDLHGSAAAKGSTGYTDPTMKAIDALHDKELHAKGKKLMQNSTLNSHLYLHGFVDTRQNWS